MKNPYYYLFYRLNSLLNKKGDNEWGPISLVSFFTLQYLFIIHRELIKLTNEDVVYNKPVLIGLTILFFVFNSILFLNPKRVKKINNTFSGESPKSKMLRGIAIVLFVLFPVIYMLN